MAFNFIWYPAAFTGFFSATAARKLDWANDTIKAHLHTSAYTPVHDTDDFFSDATSEVSWTNYSDGETLTTPTVSYDSASNTVRLLADDEVFTNVTGTGARILTLENDDGVGASTSPLLGRGDFGSDVDVTADDLTIQWDATDGVLAVTVPES